MKKIHSREPDQPGVAGQPAEQVAQHHRLIRLNASGAQLAIRSAFGAAGQVGEQGAAGEEAGPVVVDPVHRDVGSTVPVRRM